MPPITLPDPRLRQVLERLGSRIGEPTTKLWFFKRTLENYDKKPSAFKNTPLLRGLTLYYVALESLAELTWRPGPQVVKPRPILLLYRMRHPIVAILVAGTVLLGYEVGQAGFEGVQLGMAYVSQLYTPLPTVTRPAAASTRNASDVYPTSRLGPVPEEVWLVETDEQGELWSNGLRIDTSYEARTKERSYVRFPRDESLAIRWEDKPVGIVFHTSEYDITPFRSGYNDKILSTSRGLLGWIAKRDLYNYFIDRFGQVHRLVIDSHTASHAGMSIWADEDYLYLNLSDSFIGVCFESRWDPRAGTGEILTPAQIQAGLNLTDMLRAHYGISDTNCVPHGLISVNPKKMLIGYHVDWAKGFPFAALDLTDKYEVPLPSMTEFGFTYDEHLLQTLDGEMWPGVKLAEIDIAQRAKEQGLSVSVMRKQLRRRYRQQTELLKLAQIEKPSIVAEN
jgi:hypothetical protein